MQARREGMNLAMGRKRNGQVFLRGMCEVAEHLGVTRHHLWYVLRGERRSPRIESYLAARGISCGRDA